MELLKASTRKLFIIGSKDNFSSVQNWDGFFSKIKQPCNDFVVLDNVDHFYSTEGALEKLLACINVFLSKNGAI
jgi:hypothetical protein